jgi:type 1 glutamine amidotransferase
MRKLLMIAGLNVVLLLVVYLLVNAPATAQTEQTATENACMSVLIFSRTEGFRHGSIPEGIALVETLATENNWSVTQTENADRFIPGFLDDFDVVIFLNTTGDVLNNTQQDVFEDYIRNGGGYAGVHSATDTEYNWAFYGELVGAYFANHPPGTAVADVLVEDTAHPATEGLPQTWTRRDEWYNFRQNPRPHVNVLLTLDESTYDGGQMGEDHPIAWYHEYEGGRSFYTAMGHTDATYEEPLFQGHLQGGIEWAAGDPCNAGDPPTAADDTYSIGFEQPLTVNAANGVLANDTNADDAVLVTDVSDGTLTLNSDGGFTYTPDDGFSGDDSFTYRATNTDGESGIATVTITVGDAPVTPTANDDDYFIGFEQTLTVNAANGVLANDTNADDAVLVTDVSDGTLTLNSDGSFTYTPDDGFSGTDNFTYRATNADGESSVATVTIIVGGVPTDQDVEGLNAVPVIPTYTWTHQLTEGANSVPDAWYRLIVVKDDALLVDQWHEDSAICTGIACAVEGEQLDNGSYRWWVQVYLMESAAFLLSDPAGAAFTVAVTQPPTNITADPNEGRPTITWDASPGIDWAQLYIGRAGGPQHLRWYEAAAVCADGTCTVNPAIDFPGGDYMIWMRAWGAGGFSSPDGTDSSTAWVEHTPGLSLPTQAPNAPTGLIVADPVDPTFTWQSPARATWYELILTPADYAWSYPIGWFQAAEIDCAAAGQTCAYTDPLLAGGVLPAGDYLFYVRAWGPGGLSDYSEGAFTRE